MWAVHVIYSGITKQTICRWNHSRKARRTSLLCSSILSAFMIYVSFCLHVWTKAESTKNLMPELTITHYLTSCPPQSRLEHIYYGQPYARVDLNPMPGFTLSSQGLRIWLLWILYAKGICSERKCWAQIQNPIGLGHRAYELKNVKTVSSPSIVSVNAETIPCSCFLDRRRKTWKQNVFYLVRHDLIIFNYEK
jgi:hypothetical protein